MSIVLTHFIENKMSSSQVDPRNRLNDLDSSHWLQFQKSWFYFTPETPAEFIQFFTKQKREDGHPSRVGIFPENAETFQQVVEALGREAVLLNENLLSLAQNSGNPEAESSREREGEREKGGKGEFPLPPLSHSPSPPLEPGERPNDTAPEPALAPTTRHAVPKPLGRPGLDYVLIDLCNIFTDEEIYFRQGPHWLNRIHAASALMKPNGYLTLFLRNWDTNKQQTPIAWEFGKLAGGFLAMKDEKIGCELESLQSLRANSRPAAAIIKSGPEVIYCLNFRCEPAVASKAPPSPLPAWVGPNFILKNDRESPAPMEAHPARSNDDQAIKSPRDERYVEPKATWRNEDRRAWCVVKPPAREKNVLLHPAKFPEPFIQEFIERFTKPGERVLDPMAGTGSALVAARSCQREAYGIELNPAFCNIIRQRLQPTSASSVESQTSSLFDQSTGPTPAAVGWQLHCGDASAPDTYNELPASFHYIITSPPYWDMLRMKGAETQQKRKQAGLLQFYSDDERDLGNISSYEDFLERLVTIYRAVGNRLAPGRYMTIIVKNVKKKGQIFPLAWDLSLRLRPDFTLCREQFWCQDDQKLAPFGYRYAWVSNTFHHYCLHFRKPEVG
jgi:DNA modification methylase